MKLKILIKALFLIAAASGACIAQNGKQEDTGERNEETIIQLDDRGGLLIPKDLPDLKNLSLSLWIKFRGTNQPVYHYVNEAAQFHAYNEVCKRHDLNVSLGPITRLSNHYIQTAIPAHYDEPEFALLDPMTKEDQQKFLEDMSSDLYAFEYGFRVAEQKQKIKNSGKTNKAFCEEVKTNYKNSYIALMATAQRRLKNLDPLPSGQ